MTAILRITRYSSYFYARNDTFQTLHNILYFYTAQCVPDYIFTWYVWARFMLQYIFSVLFNSCCFILWCVFTHQQHLLHHQMRIKCERNKMSYEKQRAFTLKIWFVSLWNEKEKLFADSKLFFALARRNFFLTPYKIDNKQTKKKKIYFDRCICYVNFRKAFEKCKCVKKIGFVRHQIMDKITISTCMTKKKSTSTHHKVKKETKFQMTWHDTIP